MRAFACVVGAKSASWRSGVCDAIHPHRNLPILQNSPMLQIHLCFQLPLMGGRIALNGWANCNSPLHVRYPNVGKYYMQIASRAWHEDVCVRRRGKVRELAQRSMWCNSPMLQFIHIANLSHIAKFIHVAKFIHISNSPMWKGELQFAPTRVFSGC